MNSVPLISLQITPKMTFSSIVQEIVLGIGFTYLKVKATCDDRVKPKQILAHKQVLHKYIFN